MNTSGNAQTANTASSSDPYHASGQTRGGATPLLELGAGGSGTARGLLGSLIEFAGAEGGSLQGSLAAWQREQDRLANRAWRRPGGMVRPAGL
jgi:hypothetical protein